MRKITAKTLFLLPVLLFVFSLFALAQSPVGRWKTIDDNSGEVKSIVNIYEKNGKLYGDIEKLFRKPDEDQDPVCDKCTDHRKDKRIIGMNILDGLAKDGDEWEDGKIMDPENGKIYTCKIWLENAKTLKVRGYILFLYRTQTWHRAD